MKGRPLFSVLVLIMMVLGGRTYALEEVVVTEPAKMSPLAGEKRARTPEDYVRRSLKEVISMDAATKVALEGNEDLILYGGDVLPSRVEVRCSGATRPLGEGKKKLLLEWARRFAGFMEHYTGAYDKEMLCVGDGVEHWFAIKGDLAARLGKLPGGDSALNLYVIRLGAGRTSGAWETLVLVEDLQDAENSTTSATVTVMPRHEEWSAYLGRQISIDGTPRNAKLGALLVGEDASVWIDGMSRWPQAVLQGGTELCVTGTLVQRRDLPVFVPEEDGVAKAGMPVAVGSGGSDAGLRFLLKDAKWIVKGKDCGP